jgi:hypothetical protein
MAIRTIVALFDDYREAEGAIRDLESTGVPSTDINLIANNAGNRYGEYPQYGIDRPARTEDTDTASGAGTGAGIGAVLGGAAGLLAGIGALAIPGVGPVVAAGALAATLAGAGVGAAVGGLVGALVEAGIPREHADIYAEAVRRGGTLVTVRSDDALSDRVSDILNRHSPVDIEERAESWARRLAGLRRACRARHRVVFRRSAAAHRSRNAARGGYQPDRQGGRIAAGLGGTAGSQPVAPGDRTQLCPHLPAGRSAPKRQALSPPA